METLVLKMSLARFYKRYHHFTGYLIVGGVNFLLTGGLYWLFIKVFFLQYLLSFLFSWAAGVLFTYILNFICVFKPAEKLEFTKRLWKYSVVYIFSLLLNIWLLYLGVESYKMDPFWYQFFLIPLVILMNYFGIKFWALKLK